MIFLSKNKAAEHIASAAHVESVNPVSKEEKRVKRIFCIINLVKELLKCWKL